MYVIFIILAVLVGLSTSSINGCRRLGEKARLEIMKNTAHVPQVEDPEKFNEILLNFLLGAPRSAMWILAYDAWELPWIDFWDGDNYWAGPAYVSEDEWFKLSVSHLTDYS